MKLLGSGHTGKVFQTTKTINKNLTVAIKVIEKVKLDKDFDLIFEEASSLAKMDHPNLVKYYEIYQDKKYIYLVME